MIPAASIKMTSPKLLLRANVPTVQKVKIRGVSHFWGRLPIFAKIRIPQKPRIANAMFANATVKGTIDTIPEIPGLAVWVDGHIGIYIGNGEVIEAMNTLRGVTRTKLAGREWTHWLQIPYISYIDQRDAGPMPHTSNQ
mgnify:CR=1 FL=1